MYAFLLEHISRNGPDATQGRFARGGGGLLQAGFDGVDGGVAEWAHGTADEADEECLVAGELTFRIRVLWVVLGGFIQLEGLQPGFELAVGGEIDGLIGALTQGGQRYAPVERAEPFFLDDRIESVCGVAVFGDVERVGHGVVLGLEPDLDHFHRCDNGNAFRDASGESGWVGVSIFFKVWGNG